MNIQRIGSGGHARVAGVLALCVVLGAGAIPVQNLEGFEEHFGRYAPGGDCSRQPQVVVDREGFAFEGGPSLPRATRPEFAASYMGNFYEGISLFFIPYGEEPRPLLLTLNAEEQPGLMTVGVYDYDYPGGPRLPDKYRPYVDASPYRKCR